jgi:hypothetical protein
MTRWILLGASGAVLLASAILLGQDAGDFSAWVWTIIGTGTAGGALVLFCVWLWRRFEVGPVWLLVVLLLAVGVRLCLLPSQRYLSDDAYRYHWDGKVLSAGINPFAHAPEDPELDHLKTHDIDKLINHPWNHTCYPPLAQLFFALGYQLSPGSLTGLQLLILLCEIAAWLLLLFELKRRALPKAHILLIAWSPLIIYESYLPGHLDALTLPFLSFFIIALSRKWAWRAGAALACACLIKPLALLFAPAAILHLGFRQTLKSVVVFVVVVVIAYLPFLSAGWLVFESTWAMFRYWSFNASLAGILEELLPRVAARWIAAGGMVAALLLLTWRFKDLLSRLLLAVLAFVVFSPAVFPWYLVWMFPLLVLRPDPAMLLLGALVLVSEVIVIGFRLEAIWDLPLWASLIQYLPFYALVCIGYLRGWGMFRKAPEASP